MIEKGQNEIKRDGGCNLENFTKRGQRFRGQRQVVCEDLTIYD